MATILNKLAITGKACHGENEIARYHISQYAQNTQKNGKRSSSNSAKKWGSYFKRVAL